MKREILVIGIFFLFAGLAVSPSIYADRNKEFLEIRRDNDTFDYDEYPPIQLVFLLINKIYNYKNIKNFQSEEQVLQIIESDAELNGIIDYLKNFDCGCEDDPPVNWGFICTFFFIVYAIGAIIGEYTNRHTTILTKIVYNFGLKLNCWWLV